MKVSVLGIGMTKFGELWNKDVYDLSLEAATEAIIDSGLNQSKIEAVFVGNMLLSKLSGGDHLGASISSLLGLKGFSGKIESACASGGIATHLAIQSLLSGTYKNVLVVGVEKMTDVSTSQISEALMGAGSEKERWAGLTFPGLYALMAKAHMEKYGTTKKDLAQVAVKNHFHASLNPKAQFPFEISLEKALNGPMVAEPLTLFDSSPISDGAAAIVLSTQSLGNGVIISGSSVSSDSVGLYERESLTEIRAAKEASQKALAQAGVSLKDISLAEVHDCFTIAEIMAMEDLDFCPKGEGGKFVVSGTTKLGGKIPVNTSGGLKACGHPVGATGIKQIVEVTLQLRGRADKRQVKEAKVALTQNVGGTGGSVAIHILQR